MFEAGEQCLSFWAGQPDRLRMKEEVDLPVRLVPVKVFVEYKCHHAEKLYRGVLAVKVFLDGEEVDK